MYYQEGLCFISEVCQLCIFLLVTTFGSLGFWLKIKTNLLPSSQLKDTLIFLAKQDLPFQPASEVYTLGWPWMDRILRTCQDSWRSLVWLVQCCQLMHAVNISFTFLHGNGKAPAWWFYKMLRKSVPRQWLLSVVSSVYCPLKRPYVGLLLKQIQTLSKDLDSCVYSLFI